MAESAQAFNRKVGRLATTLPRSLGAATGEAALLTKGLILDKARPRTGGDLRLSGVGKNGARVGVSYDIKGFTNPTALVKATGPFHFIERDTRKHIVGRGRGGQRGRKRLRLPDGSVRMGGWMAGGSRGTAPWKQGVRLAKPRVMDTYKRAFRRELARTFTGG